MFMPSMQEPRVQRVQVPYLSGGINPGSVGEAVSDNQLTDCLNVWFQGGEVVTRPKLQKIFENHIQSNYFCVDGMQTVFSTFEGKKISCSVDKNLNFIIMSADNSIFDTGKLEANAINDIKFVLYTGKGKANNSLGVFLLLDYSYSDGGSVLNTKAVVEFYKDGGNYSEKVYSLDTNAYIPYVMMNGVGNYNANLPRTESAEILKATQLEGYNLLTGAYKCSFTSDSISHKFKLPNLPNGKVSISIATDNMPVGKAVSYCNGTNNSVVTQLIDSSFYKYISEDKVEKVKTVNFTIENGKDVSNETYYIDGRYVFYTTDGLKREERLYYRCKFNAKIDRETGEIFFPFLLADEKPLFKASGNTTIDKFTGLTINADMTNELTGAEITSSNINTSGAYVIGYSNTELSALEYKNGNYSTSSIKFWTYKEESFLAMPKNGNINNNIEVIVYNNVIDSEFKKISNCNVSEFYGGSVGLSYGTRSFVSGADNKVYFSDVDNPLYFPENCYISIGSSTEKVTALKKQGGYLVIFKENSIYYTYEEALQNENLSEAVKNQTVVDVTAQYNYRTMSVNSEIGCDLPNTIVLCMNKLIFANSDGNVYVLNSLSNYSERNIFVVSGLIKDRLKKYNKQTFKGAFAIDYSGYYMLFVDDMGFVLDYNRNSFKYVGSYTSDSSVRKYGLFSWWIWKFPKYLRFGVATDDKVTLILEYDNGFDVCTLLSVPETECESYIVSKFFDFGAPDYYKGVDSLILSVGNNYDTTLSVIHYADSIEKMSNPVEIYSTADKGQSNYLKQLNFYPHIKLCRKYGFKITAENGPMAINAVILNYSLKGRVKNGV